MENPDERIIPLNKTELFALVPIFYVVAALMAWTFLDSPPEHRAAMGTLLSAIVLLTIALFALIGVVLTLNLINRQPGLILSPRGIWNNSGGYNRNVRLIPWSDITSFSVLKLRRGEKPWLLIHIGNPLDGETVPIRMRSLRIDLRELYEECVRYHAQYGGKQE